MYKPCMMLKLLTGQVVSDLEYVPKIEGYLDIGGDVEWQARTVSQTAVHLCIGNLAVPTDTPRQTLQQTPAPSSQKHPRHDTEVNGNLH